MCPDALYKTYKVTESRTQFQAFFKEKPQKGLDFSIQRIEVDTNLSTIRKDEKKVQEANIGSLVRGGDPAHSQSQGNRCPPSKTKQ